MREEGEQEQEEEQEEEIARLTDVVAQTQALLRAHTMTQLFKVMSLAVYCIMKKELRTEKR